MRTKAGGGRGKLRSADGAALNVIHRRGSACCPALPWLPGGSGGCGPSLFLLVSEPSSIDLRCRCRATRVISRAGVLVWHDPWTCVPSA